MLCPAPRVRVRRVVTALSVSGSAGSRWAPRRVLAERDEVAQGDDRVDASVRRDVVCGTKTANLPMRDVPTGGMATPAAVFVGRWSALRSAPDTTTWINCGFDGSGVHVQVPESVTLFTPHHRRFRERGAVVGVQRAPLSGEVDGFGVVAEVRQIDVERDVADDGRLTPCTESAG